MNHLTYVVAASRLERIDRAPVPPSLGVGVLTC